MQPTWKTTSGGVAVISGNDWARISSYGKPPPLTTDQQMAQRRQQLHEKSKADVKTWGNTIEGARRGRLHAKEQREADKEAAQVKLDLEEAKYQAQLRKERIQKSKIQMFRQTDMVKSFESAQLLTEVVNERSRQGNFAEGRNRMRAEVEEARRQRMIQDILEAEREEVAKQERARQAAVATAGHQLEEAAAHRAQRRADRKAQLEQQAAIDDDYVNFIQEEADLSMTRKAEIQGMIDARHDADVVNARMKKRIGMLETITLEKAAMAKASQEEMAERRKADDLAARRLEIKKREDMAEALAVIAEDNSEQENRRIREAQEARWRAMDEEEARKERTRQGVVKEILQHRTDTLQERFEQTQAEVLADRQERADIEADTLAAAAYEATAMLEKKRRDRLILGVHRLDIATHEAAVETELEKLKRERANMNSQLDWERNAFQRYAVKQVAVSKEKGDTLTYPLGKAISTLNRDKQPKVRPNLPTVDIRRRGNPYPHNSKMRMGFTY